MHRSLGLASWFVVLAASAPLAAAQERPRREYEASDVWSDPAPGIRYLDRRTAMPTHAHAVVVDLRREGMRVVATRFEERWTTVSEFAAVHEDTAVAVNAGFWIGAQRPLGIAIGSGEPWPTSTLDPSAGVFAIDDDGRAYLFAPGEPIDPQLASTFVEAVGGRPSLLRAGEIDVPVLDAFETANDRAPRTAIGLDARRRTLFLVVVDGRQPASRGMTLYELARFMEELGATDAMNLDGGSSSQMVLPRLGGVVNVPARGRWEVAVDDVFERFTRTRERDGGTQVWVHGRETEVMNHIAVIAPRPVDPPIVAFESALGGQVEAPPPMAPIRARSRALQPRIRLGRAREWLVYVVPALALAVGTIGIVSLRRWRRR